MNLKNLPGSGKKNRTANGTTGTETPKKNMRCVVYCRKSTEEGLDQAFTSLDAQRESGQAFILSQKHEGWILDPKRYEDGGYTGANMERPALKELLADVRQGKIDCVVVQKVDRLSRSLLDFTKVLGIFEEHNVYFAAVTQQFSTSTPIGRLTLNMLMSFSQFERELISERTREKISAAKKKGKWVGGYPPMGYDVDTKARRLVVNETEAAQVREIFDLYLEQKSITRTCVELNRRGWTTKKWIKRDGVECGGSRFNKVALYRILRCYYNIGKVAYQGEIYAGEQEAILDEAIFNRVKEAMVTNRFYQGRHEKNVHGALLKGLIRCKACGKAMIHSFTTKKSLIYRYYVCIRAQKEGWSSCPTKSVPANEIEKYVVDQIRGIGKDPKLVAETIIKASGDADRRIRALEVETAMLGKELGELAAQSTQAVKDSADNPNPEELTARQAEIQDRVQVIEERLRVIPGEMAIIRNRFIDKQDLTRCLAEFELVWSRLTRLEQAHALRLLVKQVAYDGPSGSVSITFHQTGLKALGSLIAEKQLEVVNAR